MSDLPVLPAPFAADDARESLLAQIQRDVEQYWNDKPCDSELSSRQELSRQFFLEVESERYRLQSHIPSLLDSTDWAGKHVLEIGTGVGTDARRIIQRGGIYTGINIDEGSTRATELALRTFGLHGSVRRCAAAHMPFPDQSFDVVYTFGVLHHIPDVHAAMQEIRRVLKPGGEVIAMLYNRTSINYVVEIRLLRRLGVHILGYPGVVELLVRLGLAREKLERHRALSRGARRMTAAEWLSRNTDGPDNPYSQVYDEEQAGALFRNFEITGQLVRFFNHEHWGPFGRALPHSLVIALGNRRGWHRMIYARRPLTQDSR